MVVLEIRFLTGRYAAGRHDDPTKAEWPPHPARVYSALTAVHYSGGSDAGDDERAALTWLAAAGEPEVSAPEAHLRGIGSVYVPVNDSKALDSIDRNLLAVAEVERSVAVAGEGRAAEKRLKKEEAKLAERSVASAESSRSGPDSAAELLDRPRHPRHFPTALPHDDTVWIRWPKEPPEGVAPALDRLCARVSSLGHSSSFVSMRLVDAAMEVPSGHVRWIPDEEGSDFIRVPHEGQLRLLDEAFDVHEGVKPRVLPARPVRYSPAGPRGLRELPRSVFSASERKWIVCEVVPTPGEDQRRLLDLSLGQKVARALRGTLLSAIGEDAPADVTGHDPDGSPTVRTHAAFVPLADVGHPHASGSILGVAIVPPRGLGTRSRDRLLEGIFRAEQLATEDGAADETAPQRRLRLTLGRSGVLFLTRLIVPSRLRTLDPGRWCGPPARRWTTATAVALDRNPGNLYSSDSEQLERATQNAEQSVAEACVNIGLPDPTAVWIHRRSLLVGAPAARRFSPYPDGGSGPRRVCVHVEIEFAEKVKGPLILGAGRYFGLGLCVPYDKTRASYQ
jgi:CRISPR-associated protein Csb2